VKFPFEDIVKNLLSNEEVKKALREGERIGLKNHKD
jgi:hypothetical protein